LRSRLSSPRGGSTTMIATDINEKFDQLSSKIENLRGYL
jgi:hypothetical protein